MPRGTVLTPEVERIIADLYIKRPELRAKTQRFYEEVYNQVHKKIDWAEPNWPGLSVVKKRIADLRDKDRSRTAESMGLDEHWSLDSLPEYPIHPEALPLVMRIYEKNLCEAAMSEWYLSIREALWVGRLYKILELYYHDQMAKWTNPDNAEWVGDLLCTGHLPENYQEVSFENIVLDWAYVMAGEEEYRELADDPSMMEDRGSYMIGNVFYYRDERRLDFINDLAEEYGISDDKFRELISMPIEDVNQFFIRLQIERERKKRISTGKGGTKSE